MTGRRRGNDSAENGGRIPERVGNAAQNMAQQASSGPRRGYIPPDTGRFQQTPDPRTQTGRQPVYQPGYYSTVNPQQQYSSQSQMTGIQRGYIVPATPPAGKKPAGKSHKGIIVFIVILLLAALGTGGYFAVENYNHNKMISDKVEPYDTLFCPGVYVDGIHLGGMTPEQAMNSVQSQIQQRHDAWKVHLIYNGAVVSEINAEMLDFSVDPSHVMNLAWQQGHTGDQKQRYEEMLRLEQEPYVDYTAQPTGNTRVIDEKLAEIKGLIDKPARDAQFLGFDPSQTEPFLFADEEFGLSLDTEPIKTTLYQMVSTMQSGSVELVPVALEPHVRKADLQKNYMLRSYAITPIDKHSSENRNKNIQHAFDFINGYILAPGKTFSFNSVVGERTEARGFLEAIEYAYGEHVLGFGGGVCQASTTLYQAAVCAGLKITERKPHSDSVSYTEYGKDATVYWSGKRKIDLQFKNNTDGNIYIVAGVKEDPSNKMRLIATVYIYGQDMGDVTYELRTNIVEIIPAPFEPVYIKDTKGTYVTYKDQQESVSKAKEGYVVECYLVQFTKGIETDSMLLYTDRYDEKPERIYVGVKDRV